MATILIVEDTPLYQRGYQRELAEHTLIIAGTSAVARAEFARMQHTIDIIILDGELASMDPERDTVDMASDFRAAGFTGPMIAASSNPYIMNQLMEKNRCSHRASPKSDVQDLVNQILENRP